MKIVIPMGGMGWRFINQGYDIPKFLINVDGIPIVEHVINLFPGEEDFVFICNREHLARTNLEKILTTLKPKANIIAMDYIQKGPVWGTRVAFDLIKDDEPILLSYCDYNMIWDYDDFKNVISNFDGSIPSYKGFHPHSIYEKNVYAFIRVDSNNNLLEIREKKPFTEDKMNEYASAGLYYFKKGIYIKNYFNRLIDLDINVNGEYYVSMVYNLMNKDGLVTNIYDVPYFMQWGTPKDLEEYEAWSQFFADKVALKKGKTTIPIGRVLDRRILLTPLDFEKSYNYWEKAFTLMSHHPYGK